MQKHQEDDRFKGGFNQICPTKKIERKKSKCLLEMNCLSFQFFRLLFLSIFCDTNIFSRPFFCQTFFVEHFFCRSFETRTVVAKWILIQWWDEHQCCRHRRGRQNSIWHLNVAIDTHKHTHTHKNTEINII